MQKGVLGAGPKCKNPKGKLWSSQLDKDCGQSVCKLKDNKGVWEQCPRPATLEQLMEVEEKILNAVKKVEEKTEQCCCKPQTTTTAPETTVSTPAIGYKLYYEEEGAKYYAKFYGIPVAKGAPLLEGVVADTCDAVGMRAVCTGDSSCRWSSSRCVAVEFESEDCGVPMKGLAKKVCGDNTTTPRDCKELNGLFNYIKNWSGGECGVVNGAYCAQGKDYTPANPPVYYAYCVKISGGSKMFNKPNSVKIKSDLGSAMDQMDLPMFEGN